MQCRLVVILHTLHLDGNKVIIIEVYVWVISTKTVSNSVPFKMAAQPVTPQRVRDILSSFLCENEKRTPKIS